MSGYVRAFLKYLLAHWLAIVLLLGAIVLIGGMVRTLFPKRIVTVRRVTTVDTVLHNVPVPHLSIVNVAPVPVPVVDPWVAVAG